MKKIFSYFIKTILLRNLQIMLIAAFIDTIWGEPKFIYNKIPHPIIWMGNLINILDKKLNHSYHTARQQKRNGFIALGISLIISYLIGRVIQKALFKFLPKPIAYLLSGIISSIFIARRSLYEHVYDVEKALTIKDIKIARYAVSQIVGRETDQLNQSGITRAAIESLAENFSDGVTAPIFWGCIGGIPGIIVYKAINTADSMIGHKTTKYQFFGYTAAKVDDYINYPAARLSALLIILAASKKPFSDFKAVIQEARKHNSPNAGWPEAAMATCLSIYLAGPRQYKEIIIHTAWIGKGKIKLNYKDIKKSLNIFSLSCNIYYGLITVFIFFIKKYI